MYLVSCVLFKFSSFMEKPQLNSKALAILEQMLLPPQLTVLEMEKAFGSEELPVEVTEKQVVTASAIIRCVYSSTSPPDWLTSQ